MSEWRETITIVAIIACPALLWNISVKADEAVTYLREIRNLLIHRAGDR